MHRLLSALLLLSAGLIGEMFVLHPAPEAPGAPTDRWKLESEIRKILLESLQLQQEPRVSVANMKLLREQLSSSFSVPPLNLTSDLSANSPCCSRSTHVSIKDLGWDDWVVYPETFTFIQCEYCGSENSDVSAQCCGPVALEVLPFVYMDTWSLVVSSVTLTRQCGCAGTAS